MNKEFSQDALRNILTILLPSIFVFYLFDLPISIAFGVGIIIAALTDIPGNISDKRLTALICIPSFFIAGICASTGVVYAPWLIIFILAIFGFICNYALVLGPRIGAIGNLTLIIISFTLGLKPDNVLLYTIALTFGCITFFTVSLLQVYLSPHRSLKHAMDDGFENMAKLIRLKIKCYDENLPLDQVYKELSLFHIKISEQLEIVRSLLLRENNTKKQIEQTLWINKIYLLIDLYELLMANDYDYETIRQTLEHKKVLSEIRTILELLANEASQLSSNTGIDKSRTNSQEIIRNVQELKKSMINSDEDTYTILHSIVQHIEHINTIIKKVKTSQWNTDSTRISETKYKNFVSSQLSIATLKKQFNSKSPIFMYSLRMSILLTVAATIGYFLSEYKYSSWIILTIILVARPSYQITQIRNFQRIVGSIIGLIASIIILYFIPDTISLLVIAAVSLYLFYLFNKPNYLVCVIFITITIIIGLNIYQGNIFDLLGSRIVFTLLGSLFAILGCIFIPINHLKTVEKMSQVLISNYKDYLGKVNESITSNTIDFYQLRLVRKHAQTSLAQFYDAIDQFTKDPLNKQADQHLINQIETAAYRINALLIGLSVSIAKSTTTENKKKMSEQINKINVLIEELNRKAYKIILH